MVKKTVVAHYVPSFLKTEQTHVYRELTSLRNDFEMHVFTHHRENESHYPYHEKWLHLLPKSLSHSLRELVHSRLWKSTWQMNRAELRRWFLDLTRIEARVLHFQSSHSALPFLALLKAWQRPVVVSFHGSDLARYQSQPASRSAFLELFQQATLLLCRSESLVHDLVALGAPRDKVKVQRTGIPLEDWPYIERGTPENGAWQLVQGCPMLEKKGLDITLRAFAKLLPAFPNAKLLLVGEGPLRSQLHLLAQELGVGEKVQFKGYRAFGDLRKHLVDSQIFLHPSRLAINGDKEGIPTAMLEAMATGLPVVATKHSGISEAISDGESGLLVAENDHEALADAIATMLRNKELRLQMGIAARRTIEEGFSQAQHSPHLANFYRDLAV